ncbi:cupin domain-containing protein [Usitatibacter palustris]|uniref:50S ribosomal protein L16 3-hydroxylase n=1 Tax=Usitatibacter palustris TaxID=2732487 RepID=A0A6M4H624_9PROT|nr:cupin domain-containing protein [Usitatibacter palustris]QJR14388.1 50S ribosomal protein L16 3-hydroxylase [Usitatibacter palustris]
MTRKAKHSFLGRLDASTFMRRHWQRKPLLIRGAFPAFTDPIDPRGVLELATSSDAHSRLVQHRGNQWTLEHGPFSMVQLKQLPRRNWTILVQDTNHFSERAAQLLERFDFIPHARVDDLMVSYATDGGGVGPHVDSYDVFLLQGHGRRRWRISTQADVAFRQGLPLKILARFKPEQEWVLESGDMLYLPPGVAHEGVAEGECLTWSIGFRAPSDRDLVAAFLDDLRDRLDPPGHYTDPGAGAARNPGEVPAALVQHARRVLTSIRWSEADVRAFAGRFLSEPKSQVVFDPPSRPVPRARFTAQAARRGIALDGGSRLLFSGSMAFMNGEAVRVPRGAGPALRAFANHRRIEGPTRANAAFWNLAYDWYVLGFLHLAADADNAKGRR